MKTKPLRVSCIAWTLFLVATLTGCATTSGSGGGYGPPPIAEGKGRLVLEAGGINEVNFYVLDNETGDEVYAETPR